MSEADKKKGTFVSNEAWESFKHELADKNYQISEWKTLAYDMLRNFSGDSEKVITEERVECWKEKWNKLTGLDISEYF